MQHVLYKYLKSNMTVSTESAISLNFTTPRNSDSFVIRGTNSTCDFDLILICTEEVQFIDLVDFSGVAFSVELFTPIGYVTDMKHRLKVNSPHIYVNICVQHM